MIWSASAVALVVAGTALAAVTKVSATVGVSKTAVPIVTVLTPVAAPGPVTLPINLPKKLIVSPRFSHLGCAMRTAVILLNVLSVLAALAIEPIALYVGLWGLLGPAYDRPQDLVLGLVIMAAPIIITGMCVFLALRALRQGRGYAPAIAALPLVLAVLAYFNSPFFGS